MDQYIPKSYISSYAVDILICISGKIYETYMKAQMFATVYLKKKNSDICAYLVTYIKCICG